MATYLEIADLKQDENFRRRVGVAVILYASYVLGNTADTVFRETKVAWARRALASTEEQVYRLLGFILGDATVRAELAAVSDGALQGIVETAIQNNMAILA